MTSKDDVIEFLKDFIFKMEYWGLVIRLDRTNLKNANTLSLLDLTYKYIGEILKRLELEDYSEGPHRDKLYGNSDMWVFGKTIKGHEIYIKIQLGEPRSKTICISFHLAEYKMKYPFKK